MKANHNLLMAIIFILAATFVNAQEQRFFMPKEIEQAYENGTRSFDGKPGSTYWHNTVDYSIDVAVYPAEKKIEGSESVVYHNNSPDDLSTLVVRLYHDAFKKANARAYPISPDDLTDGVALKQIKIDGQEYDLTDRRAVSRRNTNLIIQLQEPLKAGKKLTMDIDWSQQIPLNPGRS